MKLDSILSLLPNDERAELQHKTIKQLIYRVNHQAAGKMNGVRAELPSDKQTDKFGIQIQTS